jgi:hypothetical protein
MRKPWYKRLFALRITEELTDEEYMSIVRRVGKNGMRPK